MIYKKIIKIINKLYIFFRDLLFLVFLAFISKKNYEISQRKEILLVSDFVSKRSKRFLLISKNLKKYGWQISLLKLKSDDEFEEDVFTRIDSYKTNNEAIYKIFKNHSSKLIFFVSNGNFDLALKSVHFFGTKIIYDPLDIWPGNLNELNANKIQKKLALKQRKIIKKVSNIVCRDIQLSALGKKIRKDKNLIYFSDYLDSENFKSIEDENFSKQGPYKFVSIGNINTMDYLNGKAYFDFIETLKNENVEFHFYMHPNHENNLDSFKNENPYFDENNKKISIHNFISPDKIIDEIRKYDCGMILMGDHFYKKYNHGIWNKKLCYKCGSSRITDYIFANLDIVLVKTEPKNYLQFFSGRYGNIYDFREISSIDFKSSKVKNKKLTNLLISKQIKRLDEYLIKVKRKNDKPFR